MTVEQLTSWTEEALTAHELSDYFVYDISLGGNKIVVYLESDSGVSFEACKKVSRHLEQHIDESGWAEGKYALDVSSPGVGSPLKYPRQYIKNVGRSIDVAYSEAGAPTLTKVKGTLESADDQQITVTWETKEKVNGKNKKITKSATISYAVIHAAKIKVTF